MKNKIKIIMGVVSTIILLLGGTYAAYTFFTEKTTVTMLVGGDQISFKAGVNITVDKISPVYSMEEGITKEIEIYKEKGDYTAGIDLYLNLKTWPSVMSSSSFRWTLYKNDAYLSSGNFSGQKQGDNIKLTSNPQKINLEEEKDSYTLYLWIDAYQESNINMMNQTFTVSLYGQTTFYKDGENPIVNEKQPNHPELADGMIPIKYNYQINEWVKADTANTNNDWYDYYNKIWANAVMVTTDSREKYMNADVGTTVSEDDILAYYVWIPRYKYVLFNTDFARISPVEIQIEFQSITDEVFNGTENGQFLTHPAFWWDNNSNSEREEGEELAGIWVGKFETSAGPTVKPNVIATRGDQVYNSFYLIKKFEGTKYLTDIGVSQVDSHMMKNMEWGAVAYLSHSKYGINKEVGINNDSLYITGRRNSYTYNDYIIIDGKITSNKEPGTGVLASTTGNVSGVYDMNGGCTEKVMIGLKNTSGGELVDYYDFKAADFVDSKYYDLYLTSGEWLDFSRSKLGDATGETNGWYDDASNFITYAHMLFLRGGSQSNVTGGGVFHFKHEASASIKSSSGVRAVLILD